MLYQICQANKSLVEFELLLQNALFIGLQTSSLHRLSESARNSIPDDSFLDQLVRCQGSRIDDQRSPLPVPLVDAESDAPIPQSNTPKSGATVPDEDFFSLIMRFQSGRMDDQRATIPRTDQRCLFSCVF